VCVCERLGVDVACTHACVWVCGWRVRWFVQTRWFSKDRWLARFPTFFFPSVFRSPSVGLLPSYTSTHALTLLTGNTVLWRTSQSRPPAASATGVCCFLPSRVLLSCERLFWFPVGHTMSELDQVVGADAARPRPSRAVRFAKDFVAGTVAGWAQVMVGQPFDT
jgi:hypothetical protein